MKRKGECLYMLKKYRIHELSKDINIPNKELIALLKKRFEGAYSHMTSLKEQELDFIFEHYTKKFECKSFENYFAPLKKKSVLPAYRIMKNSAIWLNQKSCAGLK